MLSPAAKFELELNGVKMHVQELDLPGHTAFKVVFSSERKPIIVTRTHDFNRVFWTSIPEGRQKEAEGVGKLIEEYFKKQK
jgi:hypothetical protein